MLAWGITWILSRNYSLAFLAASIISWILYSLMAIPLAVAGIISVLTIMLFLFEVFRGRRRSGIYEGVR